MSGSFLKIDTFKYLKNFSGQMSLASRLFKYVAPLVLAAGISSCDKDTALIPFCAPKSYIEEKCNRIDDDCDGLTDEDCDKDYDGYCEQGRRFEPIDFTQEKPYFVEEDWVCPESYRECTEVFTQMVLGQLTGPPHCLPKLDCDDTPDDDFLNCLSMTSLEDCLSSEYSRCAACIHPGAREYCDGVDNNCEKSAEGKFIDETFPEEGQLCGGELLPSQVDVGVCVKGAYQCRNGQLLCPTVGPSTESCNNLDDDCNGTRDDGPAQDETQGGCYHFWEQDEGGLWRKIYGRSDPERYGTPGVGICKTGIERCTTNCYAPSLPNPGRICSERVPRDAGEEYCCYEGAVGGDQICEGAQMALEDVCNCLDDDCDGEADNDLHTTILQDFIAATDCSGSMFAELGPARNAFTSVHFPDCFNELIIRISNSFVGDPTTGEPRLTRALVTGSVFGERYGSDLDAMPGGSCHDELERMLDVGAYAACIKPNLHHSAAREYPVQDHPVCQFLYEQRITPPGSTVEGSVIDYFLVGREAWPSSPDDLPSDYAVGEVEEYIKNSRRDIWREGSQKHFIGIMDEKAQTEFPEMINQLAVGELFQEYEITTWLFIDMGKHFNFSTQDNISLGTEQGYGYLAFGSYSPDEVACFRRSSSSSEACTPEEAFPGGDCLCLPVGTDQFGKVYDLDGTIASSEGLGFTIRQIFMNSYCSTDRRRR